MAKKLLLALYPLLVVLSFPASVYAEEDLLSEDLIEIDYTNVWVNEVMPNPDGSDSDYEWLEIYNDLDDQVDLSGCFIDGKSFSEGTVIGANEYLVVTKDLNDVGDQDEQSFEQRWGDHSGVWGDAESENYQVIQLSISLKNSNDSVILECGDYQNEFEWESTSSGQSLSIDIDGEVTDEYLVTPGHENEPIPPKVYAHTIRISEVYPSPSADEDEWVEFYNYGDEEIDLEGWKIEDKTKKSQLEGLIKSKGHYVVYGEDVSITLNNTGEKLKLLDPNGDVVDSFSFKETARGISNIRKWKDKKYGTTTYQTQATTKGKKNKYVDPSDVFYQCSIFPISKVRKEEIGIEMCVEGIITTPMSLLGSKQLYLQDNSGGIQLYLKDEEIGTRLRFGNKIRVFAELKEIKEEMRLYVSDLNGIQQFSSVNSLYPKVHKTGHIGENVEGQYVVVRGKIVETSGKSFYIDDGSGKVKILIKSSTNIETPKKKKGQFAGIVGIVSQYGEDSYRILPRYASDVVISDEPLTTGEVLAVAGGGISLQLFGIVCLLFLIVGIAKDYISRVTSKFQHSTFK